MTSKDITTHRLRTAYLEDPSRVVDEQGRTNEKLELVLVRSFPLPVGSPLPGLYFFFIWLSLLIQEHPSIHKSVTPNTHSSLTPKVHCLEVAVC